MTIIALSCLWPARAGQVAFVGFMARLVSSMTVTIRKANAADLELVRMIAAVDTITEPVESKKQQGDNS